MKETFFRSNTNQIWVSLFDFYKRLNYRNLSSGMKSVPVTMIPHIDGKLVKPEYFESEDNPWLP